MNPHNSGSRVIRIAQPRASQADQSYGYTRWIETLTEYACKVVGLRHEPVITTVSEAIEWNELLAAVASGDADATIPMIEAQGRPEADGLQLIPYPIALDRACVVFDSRLITGKSELLWSQALPWYLWVVILVKALSLVVPAKLNFEKALARKLTIIGLELISLLLPLSFLTLQTFALNQRFRLQKYPFTSVHDAATQALDQGKLILTDKESSMLSAIENQFFYRNQTWHKVVEKSEKRGLVKRVDTQTEARMLYEGYDNIILLSASTLFWGRFFRGITKPADFKPLVMTGGKARPLFAYGQGNSSLLQDFNLGLIMVREFGYRDKKDRRDRRILNEDDASKWLTRQLHKQHPISVEEIIPVVGISTGIEALTIFLLLLEEYWSRLRLGSFRVYPRPVASSNEA